MCALFEAQSFNTFANFNEEMVKKDIIAFLCDLWIKPDGEKEVREIRDL